MFELSRKKYDLKVLSAAIAALCAAGCSSESGGGTGPQSLSCGALDPAYLADGGVGRDGIPALTDPDFVTLDTEEMIRYLTDDDRIIGVEVGGEWLAFPHNIMYRHEIVNLNRGAEQIAVTYCPLTGSALVFDRAGVDGIEFGVSGLLYQANLIMYDRASSTSLWPQMAGEAGCGPHAGQSLVRQSVIEMTWGGWKEHFPRSMVIAVDSISAGGYSFNPYGSSYEAADNASYLGFPIPRADLRRLPKERVLGFPAAAGQPPLALPFDAMSALGERSVAQFEYLGQPAVVFWDGVARSAIPARPVADGRQLTFEIRDGRIVDNETGSVWAVTGEARVGELMGSRLEPIPEAYVAFWQAWAAYHPATELVIE